MAITATPHDGPRRQFTLREAFLALTFVAACCGLAAWVGMFALALIPWVGFLAAARLRWISWRDAGAVIGVSGALLVLLLPAVQPRPHFQVQRKCGYQLRNVGIALHAYHNVHRVFPPIASHDSSGRPLHSWRTLILPHVEREDLYDQYDLAEPWDGPVNSQLHSQPVKLFHCPCDRLAKNGQTSYVAVIMPGAKPGEAFPVVELPLTGIHCLEPRDITLAELDVIAAQARTSFCQHADHSAVHFLWPDGTVQIVDLKKLPATLRQRWKP